MGTGALSTRALPLCVAREDFVTHAVLDQVWSGGVLPHYYMVLKGTREENQLFGSGLPYCGVLFSPTDCLAVRSPPIMNPSVFLCTLTLLALCSMKCGVSLYQRLA